jgi:hypothetical protein
MKSLKIVCVLAMVLAVSGLAAAAQDSHEHMPSSTLKPAQGASVKIVSPKPGQLIKGDSVPLEFKLVKGKIGEHVHAYVDGEMAGMFKGSKGTLNGLKPGTHTLELRVTTGDHNTELNATDKVSFTTK